MARIGRLFLSSTFVGYLLTSVVALGCDFASFLLLLRADMTPMAASAAGYLFGIVIHWLLSTRLVFANGMDSEGLERVREKGLFVGTALIGLAITTGMVGLGTQVGVYPVLAKLAAVGVSFLTTYLLRRVTIFRA
jgi:putative flippase GtrA